MQPPPDDPLGRSFRLAYFVLRDPIPAFQVAVEAWDKLEVAAAAQDRRRYYTPRQKRRRSTGGRTKISLGKLQLLQRLVLSESEIHEREQEHSAEPRPLHRGDMIVRFVKHLVRITLRRNSFHVTLALARLLHAYSTEETMALYELLMQDPDRFKDEPYYRSRKRLLLREVRERFGSRVSTCRGPRGETRLAAYADGRPFAALVEECLRRFTPWDTPCPLPEHFDPGHAALAALAFEGGHPDGEHDVELRRMHAVLHPSCFRRLLAALGLDAPEHRLAVPTFRMAWSDDDPPFDDRDPPPFGDAERRAADQELALRQERRRRARAGLLRILADGREVGRLDLKHGDRVRFEVGEDIEFVEVRSGEDVTMAICPLPLAGASQPLSTSVVLEGGQRFDFTLSALDDDSVSSWRLEMKYTETRLSRVLILAWRRFVSRPHTLRAAWAAPALLTVALLTVVLTGTIGAAFYLRSHPAATDSESLPEKPKIRGERLISAATPIAAVERIHVLSFGDEGWRRRVRQVLVAELRGSSLATSGRIVLVASPGDAEAVLKLDVAGRTARDPGNEGSLALVLASRAGEVLWSGTSAGTSDDVARLLAADLLRALSP